MKRRALIACFACVAGAGAGGCSLAFGIHDNLGPLVDGGVEGAAGGDADDDATAGADAGEPLDADAAPGPVDAPPDVPPRTDWCVLADGGAGHLFCDDFDVHPPALPPEMSPASAGSNVVVTSDTTWSTSGANALYASAGPGGTVAQAVHRETSSKQVAVLGLDMRVDADDSAIEDHLFGLEFDGPCSTSDTQYSVFVGVSGTSTFFNEFGNVSMSGSGYVNGPPVALATTQHVKLTVDLAAKSATVCIAGSCVHRALTPSCTPTFTQLDVGLSYRSQATAGVVFRADDVTLDLQ